MEDVGGDRLKNALLGLIPDNWRMYVTLVGLAIFVLTNPQAAWFIVGKLFSGVSALVGKVSSIKLGDLPSITAAATPSESGIEAPLQAAQAQIAWAVKNGNSQVLEAGINSLKALVAVKAAAVLLVLGMVGCSGRLEIKSEPSKESSQGDCEYSHTHTFGYTPPPAAEKERMYGSEPTLFQQEPDLAK